MANMGLKVPEIDMNTSHPWKLRIFIDTEFTDLTAPRLISLAMVSEDGAEFYGELADFDRKACSEFSQAIVLPQLGQFPEQIMEWDRLREAAQRWMSQFTHLKKKPVICYDYPLDVTLLFDLLGAKPARWQLLNVAGRIDPAKREQYFHEHGGRHHALYDARANRAAYG